MKTKKKVVSAKELANLNPKAAQKNPLETRSEYIPFRATKTAKIRLSEIIKEFNCKTFGDLVEKITMGDIILKDKNSI